MQMTSILQMIQIDNIEMCDEQNLSIEKNMA